MNLKLIAAVGVVVCAASPAGAFTAVGAAATVDVLDKGEKVVVKTVQDIWSGLDALAPKVAHSNGVEEASILPKDCKNPTVPKDERYSMSFDFGVRASKGEGGGGSSLEPEKYEIALQMLKDAVKLPGKVLSSLAPEQSAVLSWTLEWNGAHCDGDPATYLDGVHMTLTRSQATQGMDLKSVVTSRNFVHDGDRVYSVPIDVRVEKATLASDKSVGVSIHVDGKGGCKISGKGIHLDDPDSCVIKKSAPGSGSQANR